MAGAIDEPEDDFDLFNTSFNSPLGSPRVEMNEEEEGVEETEKQRQEDVDYKYPSKSTLPDEERLVEKGPHRCMTNLEALSALASRTGASHAMATLMANGGYNDRGFIGTKITLDQAKVLRSRMKWGDIRTLARLAKALRMDAIYFDERIDDTVIREVKTTTVTMRGVSRRKSPHQSNAVSKRSIALFACLARTVKKRSTSKPLSWKRGKDVPWPTC